MSIALIFNVDGLPIYKSSQKCFWPILASVYSKYCLSADYSVSNTFVRVFNILIFQHVITEMREIKPMIIGIWCGFGKPNDLNEFLRPFVNEFKELLAQGMNINGYTLSVNCHCFVCDTPARAFMKGVLDYDLQKYLISNCKFILYRHCLFHASVRMPKMFSRRKTSSKSYVLSLS